MLDLKLTLANDLIQTIYTLDALVESSSHVQVLYLYTVQLCWKLCHFIVGIDILFLLVFNHLVLALKYKF